MSDNAKHDATAGASTDIDGDFGSGSSTMPASTAAATAAAQRAKATHTSPGNSGVITPSYKQNLGLEDVEHGFYGSMMNGIGAFAGFFGQIPCCFCCPNPFKEIQQGSVGLVSRFGKAYRAEDPGLVQINPCSESLRIVDVKIQISPIPSQTVMTKDNVSTNIDSIIYWHISNPYRAAYGISDVKAALVERAQTTLRHVVGSRTLQSVISDREQVAAEIEEIVEGVAEKWGVQVESILIKDIIFSKELQESLSSAATSKRIGESKVIAARAEVDAARLMRQAADILASPAAMQIRQLEALQAMAKAANSKVVFVPMNLDGPGAQALVNSQGVEPISSAGPAAASTSATRSGGLSVQDAASINQLTQM
ncbi:related to stomatin [Pseudozyma flocculosa]|uniref:Related to stomatin n=1 Tax=Pseudozyma flocculosa TaxID=84751 RepID=A0A5C3FD69_9BASI|nr:related to stomatin [Pseudozyma flocculosa]